MKEQLINFETAFLAKEKGFEIPTRNFYANWDGNTLYKCSDVGFPEFTNDGLSGFGKILLVPTQSLLQRWMREEHNISVTIDSHLKKHPILDYFYMIYDVNKYHIHRHKEYYESYEIALEKGLYEALTLIK